jgi:hypothetical protein
VARETGELRTRHMYSESQGRSYHFKKKQATVSDATGIHWMRD